MSLKKGFITLFFNILNITHCLASDLWVDALKGSDSQDGLTATTALKTIQAAAERATAGTTVHIQTGIYRETVTPKNSGTVDAPIIYHAETGTYLRGSESSAELTWTSLAENDLGLPATVDFSQIVWTDLSAWELTQAPRFVMQMGAPDSEAHRLTVAREPDWHVLTDWKYHELWWTAEGGATVANCNPVTDKDRWNCDKATRSLTQLLDTQNDPEPVAPGNLTTLGNLTGATLITTDPFQGNYIFRRTLVDHDVTKGQITVDRPAQRASTTNSAGLGWGSKYYVENHPLLLDTPGEYWFDAETHRLYLWPFPTTDLKNLEISRRDNGWNMRNRSYLQLEGLVLEFFNEKAITVDNDAQQGSHQLQFRDLEIRFADQGLNVTQELTAASPASSGTDNLLLENSKINEMDTHAVYLGSQWENESDPATFTRPPISETTLKHNEFSQLGFRSTLDHSAGLVVTFPDHFRFEDNHLHHVAYNGLEFNHSVIQSAKTFDFDPAEIKTGNILILNNTLEKACLALSVCAGIQFSGTAPHSHVFRDVLISGNTIRHHLGWAFASEQRGWWATGKGGYGIFLAEISGVHLYRNVIHGNGWANVMLTGNWRDGEIMLFNNVLADSYLGMEFWNDSAVDARGAVNTQIQNNLFVNNERYGFQHTIDPALNDPQFKSDNNLYHANGWSKDAKKGILNAHGTPYPTLEEVKTKTPWEVNSLSENPLFVRYNYESERANLGESAGVDFHLAEHSPAVRQDIFLLPLSLKALIEPVADIEDFSQNLGPFENFYTQGLAADSTGQALTTDSFLSGGILAESGKQGDDLTISATETVTITADMLVDPMDVDQPANLVMVGGYTPPAAAQTFYYTRQNDQWQPWDTQLQTLAVAETVERLSTQQKAIIYQGNFAGILGNFVVYVGYRLPDGKIVFNGQRPLHFLVQ